VEDDLPESGSRPRQCVAGGAADPSGIPADLLDGAAAAGQGRALPRVPRVGLHVAWRLDHARAGAPRPDERHELPQEGRRLVDAPALLAAWRHAGPGWAAQPAPLRTDH